MSKYWKKPVVIEAEQFTRPDFWADVDKNRMLIEEYEKGNIVIEHNKLNIKTLEGVMTASLGDYIIKGIKGEIYPCKPDIFAETYEALG